MPVFRAQVLLRAPVAEVWDFHMQPHALSRLTPPDGDVHIVNEVAVAPGAEVVMKVRMGPLPVRTTWRSRFASVERCRGYVDVAVGGMFPLWEHHHLFSDENGRCLLREEVRYQAPLGAVGNAVAGPMVRRMLERQLGYRHRVLAGIFGEG